MGYPVRGTAHPARTTIPWGVDFSVTVQLDSNGDQTGSLAQDNDIALSLTHTSTGLYELLLSNKWYGGCRQLVVTVIKATSPNVIPFIAGTPSTDPYDATPSIKFGFMDTTANLANPVSCYLQISGILKQQTGV